jgi:hypothetical protein
VPDTMGRWGLLMRREPSAPAGFHCMVLGEALANSAAGELTSSVGCEPSAAAEVFEMLLEVAAPSILMSEAAGDAAASWSSEAAVTGCPSVGDCSTVACGAVSAAVVRASLAEYAAGQTSQTG